MNTGKFVYSRQLIAGLKKFIDGLWPWINKSEEEK